MALKYPGATWDPLGTQTEPMMSAHDILCLHTMVGTLSGTSSMFHQNGYGGTESHFGVGETKAQGVKQWQDLMHTADANLDGNDRVVSVETADWGGSFGTWDDSGKSGDQVPAWTNDQLDMIVGIVVWFCKKETHANCPSTWACHKAGVPCVLIPDTKQGRRGIGYHRQGIDPWRCATCEKWSNSTGKVCPGAKRTTQLINIVIPRAQKILAGGQEDDMPYTEAQLRAMIQAELEEFATRHGVDDVDEKVWNRQIADVSTPESGDTSAAATLLTWTATRAAEQAVQALKPQLDALQQAVEALAAPKA